MHSSEVRRFIAMDLTSFCIFGGVAVLIVVAAIGDKTGICSSRIAAGSVACVIGV